MHVVEAFVSGEKPSTKAALATLAKGLIGFLIPGAVMFLWLLVFNQWRRLRPLYLPTGLLLFALGPDMHAHALLLARD